MNKTSISAKQMETTIALYLIGSSLVSGGSSRAKQDTWLCVLAALVMIIPMIWVHSEILKLYPGQDYFQNIFRAVGRPAGTAVSVLLIINTLNIGAIVLRLFSEFVHIVNMTETPIIAIMVCISAVTVYVLSNRLYVLARLSKFVFPFLLVAVAITIVLSYKEMDWNHLKPVLHSKPADLLGGVLSSFTIPYSEIVICAPMFGALDRKAKIFPSFLNGVFLAFIIVFSANLRNMLVLGYSTEVFNFPSYESVSVISLGEFFTRIEVLIGINLLLAGFIKGGVLLFSTCQGLAKVFGYKDYEPLVAPVSLLILTASILISDSTVEMYRWIEDLPYYSMPFQVFLPILVLVIGKIRKKIEKSKKQGKEPAKEGKESIPLKPQKS
ncbi:GerAB/ArcD/ProY family transporter [Caproicibacter sp. BJN0012]|uniref:GerAB/ArcD/ProY family transporter n=1 Tax=Caproicibacter sp. BJN0012 TaxID=3110227 RepID=UPI002E1576E0|nr:endospore germination permease [Caproicibacter sp. BJN0012]